jgi:hypothetical protein
LTGTSQQPTSGIPCSQHGFTDLELDSLLTNVSPTLLRAGFADRVIQSVQPAGSERGQAKPAAFLSFGSFRALGVAAALVFCGGLVWWGVSSPGARLSFANSRPLSAPTEEELLLKALATLEINSGDLALVAQLGDVLEAELTERTSWLEKE